MRRLRFVLSLLLGTVVLLRPGLAVAQRAATLPPSDFGIGNQSLSPDAGAYGGANNSLSFSPNINQIITNTTGSAVGNQYPNAAFGGYGTAQTSGIALAQGATGATQDASASAGLWLPPAVHPVTMVNFVSPAAGSGLAQAMGRK
ncbi:MAG: hypothetical protein ACE14L_14210 [Terriglobales bacterium]